MLFNLPPPTALLVPPAIPFPNPPPTELLLPCIPLLPPPPTKLANVAYAAL